MRKFSLTVATIAFLVSAAGCSGGGDAPSASRPDARSTFHHNNREYQKWVKNPSDTPKYRNPSTGGAMF